MPDKIIGQIYYRYGTRRESYPVYEHGLEKSLQWFNSLDKERQLFITKDWFGNRRINLKPKEIEKVYSISKWNHLMPKEFC